MKKTSKNTLSKFAHIVNKDENQKRSVEELQSFYNFEGGISFYNHLKDEDERQRKMTDTHSNLGRKSKMLKVSNSTFYGHKAHENKANDMTMSHYYQNSNLKEYFKYSEPIVPEIEHLVKYYNTSSVDTFQDEYDKEATYSKYGILNQVSLEEEKKIKQNLKDKQLFNLNKMCFENPGELAVLRKKFEGVEKSLATSKSEKLFKNPVDSLSKLKANSQIFASAMSIFTKKQITEYINKISEVKEIYDIKVASKDIRTTDLNRMNVPEEAHVGFDSERSIINNRDFLSKNKHSISNTVSRETVLSDINLRASVYTGCKIKPHARAQFTMTVSGHSFYIIGGVCDERLFEIWVCDCKYKYEWKQLFPKGESVNPRMGHTAALFQNMIYVFGGNTKSDLPTDDIAIYDISKFQLYKDSFKYSFR